MRRIPVDRILQNINDSDRTISRIPNPSITKLKDYVKKYSKADPPTKDEFVPIVRITYLDEEEENIDISTDLELFEAITSLHKYPNSSDSTESKHNEHNYIKAEDENYSGNQHILRLNASVHLLRKHVALRNQLESLPPVFQKINQIPIRTDPNMKLPAGIVVIDALFSLVANVLDNFQKSQEEHYKYQQQQKQKQKFDAQYRTRCHNPKFTPKYSKVLPPESAVKDKDHTFFDNKFVHKRHSCDNCKVSPILGYRYHSIKKANYDLCHECFCEKCDSKCFEEELTSFRLVQNKPDRFFKRTKNQRIKMSVKDIYGILGKRRRQVQEPLTTGKCNEITNESRGINAIVNDEIIQKCLKDIREKKNNSQYNQKPNQVQNKDSLEIKIETLPEGFKNNSIFKRMNEDPIVVVEDNDVLTLPPTSESGMKRLEKEEKDEFSGCEGLDNLIHLAEYELKQINKLSFTSMASMDDSERINQKVENDGELAEKHDIVIVEKRDVPEFALNGEESEDNRMTFNSIEKSDIKCESCSSLHDSGEIRAVVSISSVASEMEGDFLDNDDIVDSVTSIGSESSVNEVVGIDEVVHDKYFIMEEDKHDIVEDDWEMMDESDDDFAIID